MKRTPQSAETLRRLSVPAPVFRVLRLAPLAIAMTARAAGLADTAIAAGHEPSAPAMMLAGVGLIVLASLGRRFKKVLIKGQTQLP